MSKETLSEEPNYDVAFIRQRLLEAAELTKFFPAHWPAPDVTWDDTQGDFDMEWYTSKGRMVSVWMRDKHISWAGIFDERTSHGRCPEEDKMPPECYSFIQLVLK